MAAGQGLSAARGVAQLRAREGGVVLREDVRLGVLSTSLINMGYFVCTCFWAFFGITVLQSKRDQSLVGAGHHLHGIYRQSQK